MTADSKGGGTSPVPGGVGSAASAGSVRVVTCDKDTGSADRLRALLDQIPGVRVVEAVSDPQKMSDSVERFSADLVLASLDSEPETVMTAVSAAAKVHRETAFFAVSTKNDANLILSAMRSGFSEFVRLPDESARLVDAIGGLRHRVASDGSSGQIVTVIGSAGGVGCTTVAVNLAVELAEKSRQEVALVDLDFQFGHVAMLLDLDIQHSIADLCGQGKTIDERVVQKATMKHKSNVHVVARPKEFEDTESLSAEACVQLMGILKRMYPYVVLDGPTRFDPTGRAILDMADWNILVVQPLVTAARNAKRILQALKKYDFNLDAIQVVCNRAGGGLSHLNVQRLEKSLGHKIIACIPDDWTSVSAAINLGEPLAMNAPKSKARDAIRELADLIRGRDGADGKAGGILSRLFGGSKGGSGESSGG